jgi:probable F420-dependent oxidoreductase
MDLGITIFPTQDSIRIDELAREAEGRGFESLFVPEHTHIPASRKTPFPGGGDLPEHYWQTLDPFVALAAAAAVTETIKIGTGICLVIERDTIITAKEVASLDQLSNGRLLFGVGYGWNREEMENHGTDFDSRFQRLEEQVQAMKRIWTEDEPEFHGEIVDFDPIWSWPKPAQKPHPPILIGGHTRHTRRRVVEMADGWLPIGISQASVLKGLEDLRQRAEEAGRDMATIDVTVYGVQGDREELDRYAEAGVNRGVFFLPSKARDDVLPVLDRYARLIAD